jgi:flagellar assembly protein FliH
MSETTTNPKARVISGANETAFQRWELPVMEGALADGRPPTAQQLEQIQRQAYDEGFAQGLRDAGQQVRLQSERLERLLAALAGPFAEMDQEAEQELVCLATAIARQLVRRELRLDPAAVIGAVREAMALLPAAARNVRIHLHPEDAQLVRTALTLPEGERAWHIVEDAVLTRGDCRVLSDTSQIDARVETRLANIFTALLGGDRKNDPVPA